MKNMITFGKRLQNIRERQNITVEEVSDKLSISASGYKKYERNEREPKFELLIKISEILSVSVDYLLGINKISKDPIENWLIDIHLSTENKKEVMKNIWKQVNKL
jgi:transcriptional regulator with XRE-family HTH domain